MTTNTSADTTGSQSPPEQAVQSDVVREAREQFVREMEALVSCANASPHHTAGSRETARVMRDAAIRSFDAALALATPPAPVEGVNKLADELAALPIRQMVLDVDAGTVSTRQETVVPRDLRDRILAALRATASPAPVVDNEAALRDTQADLCSTDERQAPDSVSPGSITNISVINENWRAPAPFYLGKPHTPSAASS